MEHSLEDFLRDPREVIQRIKSSGEPEVMTSGDTSVVLQERSAYLRLEEEAAFARDIRAIKEGLAQANRNEGSSPREVFGRVAEKHGFEFRQ